MSLKILFLFYYVSLGLAIQRQKLLSSPRFGTFKADFPAIRRNDSFTDSGIVLGGANGLHARIHKSEHPLEHATETFGEDPLEK